MSELFHRSRILAALLSRQAKECGRTGHRCISDHESVRQIEESPQETPVIAQCLVENVAPRGITKIAVDVRRHDGIQWSAGGVSLHDAAGGQQFRVSVAHAVWEG